MRLKGTKMEILAAIAQMMQTLEQVVLTSTDKKLAARALQTLKAANPTYHWCRRHKDITLISDEHLPEWEECRCKQYRGKQDDD